MAQLRKFKDILIWTSLNMNLCMNQIISCFVVPDTDSVINNGQASDEAKTYSAVFKSNVQVEQAKPT